MPKEEILEKQIWSIVARELSGKTLDANLAQHITQSIVGYLRVAMIGNLDRLKEVIVDTLYKHMGLNLMVNEDYFLEIEDIAEEVVKEMEEEK